MSGSRDEFWEAILQVESGGNRNMQQRGDGGRAIGPLQIHRNYYEDAVAHNPSLKSGKYENCEGPGSFEYSKAVGNAYMDRYATERRLGHPPTYEDMARIHNGGPNGYKNDGSKKMEATLKYWAKVKEHL